MLKDGDKDRPYIIALHRLTPINLWNAQGKIVGESMTLGFVVPEDEVYVALHQAQTEITNAAQRILKWQTVSSVISLLLVLIAVFAMSRKITAGLIALASAARRMKDKDYGTRVAISVRRRGRRGLRRLQQHGRRNPELYREPRTPRYRPDPRIGRGGEGDQPAERAAQGREHAPGRRARCRPPDPDDGAAARRGTERGPPARYRRPYEPGRRGRRRLLRRSDSGRPGRNSASAM